MNEPQRYAVSGNYAQMIELTDGNYVRWNDYERLKSDLERVRKHRDTLVDRLDKALEDVHRSQFGHGKWQLISTAFLSREDWMLGYYTTEHGESLVDVIFRWSDGTFTDSSDAKVKPTHWMPLPKPPTA